MKLEITREWFERKVMQEGDLEIAAGILARDPLPETQEAEQVEEVADPMRFAFGSLVEYLRRERGLSMEKFAEQAEVAMAEIMSIERDAHFRPEPRTVYQIAHTFKLSNKALLELSGNSRARDTKVHEQALRFAARSGGTVQNLSKDEQKALEEFIAYLGQESWTEN